MAPGADQLFGAILLPALTGGVGGYLQAVAAKLHAAPSPRAFLAGIHEMKYAVSALADALAVSIGKEHCRALGDWSKKMRKRLRLKCGFDSYRVASPAELRRHRMLFHQPVYLVDQ
jgi:hypothetical protein